MSDHDFVALRVRRIVGLKSIAGLLKFQRTITVNTEQTATFLKTVPLFLELPEEHFRQLAQSVRTVKLTEGQLVAESPDGEPSLYVIVEGECLEYTEQGGLGMEVQTRRFYPGDFFNAESVIEDQPSPCRVKSLMAGRALAVPKSEVDKLLAASPEFARTLCRIFATRVRQSLETVSGIRFVHLKDFRNLDSLAHLVPRKVLSISRSIVVEQDGDRVTVAMVNPSDLRARSFIQDVLRDYHVHFTAIGEEDFEKHGRKLLGERIEMGPTNIPFDSLIYQNSEGVVRPLSGSPEDDLLSKILTLAVRRLASDVHFEPFRGRARVRLRVDGRMIVIDEDIAAPTYRHMAARIKVLAELDTTRIRRPQDGRFLLRVDDHPIEFRVSASPCHGGEKIVLRIVAPSKQYSDLSRLIICPPFERTAQELFRSPSGLVLVTGPSGAGKTTTLYAALSSVVAADGTKNIVTIEDPVEYDLPFATQIQVNRETGMDFPSILKSVLRQDPDVILVGEIRDPESAAMAAEAATTGHLVLSSLHTYSCARGSRPVARPAGSSLFDRGGTQGRGDAATAAASGARLYRRCATR